MNEGILDIAQMSCASCAARVEAAALGTEGVQTAQVNLLTQQLTYQAEDGSFDLDQLIHRVTEAGYPASVPSQAVSLKYTIQGLGCASCVAKVESGLSKEEGVLNISVNLASEKVSLRIDPAKITTTQIKEKVVGLGFELLEMEVGDSADQAHSNQKEAEKQDLKRRFVGSAALSLPLFILAMAPMVGLPLPHAVSPDSPATYGLVELLLCLPVMFLGRGFYSRGLKAFWHRAPNMDSLIAVGTLASFGYSLFGLSNLFQGNLSGLEELYFESTGVILTMILMGKWLESGAKQKSVEAMKGLLKLQPSTAKLLGAEGGITEIPIHEIMPSDRLLVQIGERVPIDGEIAQGETSVDQSFLTGESLPVEKGPGDTVIGGSLNQGQPFEMIAQKTSEDSTLHQIILLVEEANGSKAPVSRLADRISGIFVPSVMALASLSALFWVLAGDPAFALKSFVAVMVIACPCALGLATPTAIMVGVGRGASLGILIKGGEALEDSVKLDRVVFDKTGTLTQGKPKVTEFFNLGAEDEALAVAYFAGAEARSEHLLAKAILAYATERNIAPADLDQCELVKSLGVKAQVGESALLVGNFQFLAAQGVTASEPEVGQEQSKQGHTAIYLAVDNQLWAMVAIADPVKPEAAQVIRGLEKMGIKPLMLTGDNPQVAQSIAAQVGLSEFHAGLMPADKLDIIKAYQAKGERLAMVGDGINDAPAMMQAELGVAIGQGADVAIEAADFVLVKENLNTLLDALQLSRGVMRKIKQNLFWAFGYNVMGIPFAAGVFVWFGGPALSPMIAALAMALSSVSVLTNSLTLRLFQPGRA